MSPLSTAAGLASGISAGLRDVAGLYGLMRGQREEERLAKLAPLQEELLKNQVAASGNELGMAGLRRTGVEQQNEAVRTGLARDQLQLKELEDARKLVKFDDTNNVWGNPIDAKYHEGIARQNRWIDDNGYIQKGNIPKIREIGIQPQSVKERAILQAGEIDKQIAALPTAPATGIYTGIGGPEADAAAKEQADIIAKQRADLLRKKNHILPVAKMDLRTVFNPTTNMYETYDDNTGMPVAEMLGKVSEKIRIEQLKAEAEAKEKAATDARIVSEGKLNRESRERAAVKPEKESPVDWRVRTAFVDESGRRYNQGDIVSLDKYNRTHVAFKEKYGSRLDPVATSAIESLMRGEINKQGAPPGTGTIYDQWRTPR